MSRRSALPLLRSLLPVLALVIAGPAAAQLAPEPIEPILCLEAPDGTPCDGTDDNDDDCLISVCKNGSCVDDQPSPLDLPCTDTDGNACTEARCVPNTGTCDQQNPVDPFAFCPDDGNICTRPACDPADGQCRQVPQGDGKPCGSGERPEFCPASTCQGGICVPAGDGRPAPDPQDPANVLTTARPERVTENEAFIDCCVICAHQSLEAIRPAPNGPLPFEAGGGLPLRRKLCGSVVGGGIGYGVNDERDDPRDMLINIEPGPQFEELLAGSLQTACSKMTEAEREQFKVSDDAECPVADCRLAAVLAANDPARQRCVHSEITPPQQFFRQDRRFLPIDSSGPCSDDPSSGCVSQLEQASAGIGDVCVYGVFSYDHGEDHRAADHQAFCCLQDGGGHDYPEIHPFDAVWWRHPSHDGWMFGVFQDDSNRYSFPHCGSQNNGNRWSQAPRDVTFRFPFSIPRSKLPIQACIRYVHTEDFSGAANVVVPLNVSTDNVDAPLTEAKLFGDANQLLLEVVEPPGKERETQVRIDGCAVDTEIKGFITLRVAVGCSEEMRCTGLRDPEDPGSGFYYAELIFTDNCERLR